MVDRLLDLQNPDRRGRGRTGPIRSDPIPLGGAVAGFPARDRLVGGVSEHILGIKIGRTDRSGIGQCARAYRHGPQQTYFGTKSELKTRTRYRISTVFRPRNRNEVLRL
ncbi:hypothetical protein KM043_008857 [Ampulex compressa]|nr:hypothetical protein KM043_008857 [Ampulex compressa]